MKLKATIPVTPFIYTDGSKLENTTGCTVIYQKKMNKKHFPSETSIFSAKVCATDLAVSIISIKTSRTLIIFSDSLSFLIVLKNKNKNKALENP